MASFSEIFEKVSSGEISANEAADMLEAIGIDPADVAGELMEAEAMAETGY